MTTAARRWRSASISTTAPIFSLEKGDKAGSGRARIDLDIGKGVKLRGEANDSGEAKGGIFFEREY